ncbi:MAG: hypothetical protein ACI8PZ_001285 [Myxococcota bacterium]|jgi:hypothetical protein
MQATIRSYLGTENFVERFEVRLDDGRKGELRWADCDRTMLADATSRIRDASAFLMAHPHPVAPEAIGTVSTKDGVGLIISRFAGPTLSTLCVDPLELDVALEISGRLADYLIHLANLRDAVHRPFEVALRNLALNTVRLSATAEVRITGVETLGGDWPGRVVRTTHLERNRDTRLAVLGKGPADDIFDLGRIILALIAGRGAVDGLDDEVNRAADGTLHDKAVFEALSPRKLQAPYSLLALLQRMLSFYPDERPEPQEVRASVFELFASPVALEAYAREVCSGYRYVPLGRHAMIGRVFDLDGGMDALPQVEEALVEVLPTEEIELPRAPAYAGGTQPQRAAVRSEARPTPGQPAFQLERGRRPTIAESASVTAKKIARKRTVSDEPETVLGLVRLRSRNAEHEVERAEVPVVQAPIEVAPLPAPPPPPMPVVGLAPQLDHAPKPRPTWMLVAAPMLGAVVGIVLGLAAIAIGGLFVLLLQLLF